MIALVDGDLAAARRFIAEAADVAEGMAGPQPQRHMPEQARLTGAGIRPSSMSTGPSRQSLRILAARARGMPVDGREIWMRIDIDRAPSMTWRTWKVAAQPVSPDELPIIPID